MPENTAATPDPAGAIASGQAAGPALVLLVEDDDSHAELIARAFANLPDWRRPIISRTIRDARRVLAETNVDLIVVDFILPDGRGVELLDFQGGDSSHPIVVLTSHGDEQLAVDAMKAGAMDYVVKTDSIFRALPQICDRVLREWRNICQRKAAESALRLNEHMVSATNDLIVYVDNSFRIQAANSRYVEMMGKSASEVIGRASSDVVGEPLFSSTVRPCVERALAGERHTVQSWRDYAGAGLRFMDIEYSPYVGDDDRVEGVVIRARDITKMRKVVDDLSVSEARLRTIVDSEPECVKTVAGDGTVVEMNPAGLVLLGVENASQILGKSVYTVIRPDFRDAFRDLHDAVMRGESGTLEYVVINATGEERWVETHAVPLRDATDEVTAQLAVTRDFTERHRMEAKLRSSEARFRGLFENVPTGVFRASRAGLVELANPSLLRTLGCDRLEQLTGGDGISGRFADPRKWSTVVRGLVDQGQVEGVECRLKRQDGTELEALLSVRAVVSPDGSELFEGTVVDITELRDARAAVERSERLLRTVIDLVPHMIFVRDGEGRFILANKATARMMQTDVKSLTGTIPKAELTVSPSITKLNDEIVASVGGGQPRAIRSRRVELRDGSLRSFDVNTIPFLPPGSSLAAVVGVAEDVTEQKRAYDLLVAQRHAMESIASGAPVEHTLENLCADIEFIEGGPVCCVVETAPEGRRVFGAPRLPGKVARFLGGGDLLPSASAKVDATVDVVRLADDPNWRAWRNSPAAELGFVTCWRTSLVGVGEAPIGEIFVFWDTECEPKPGQGETVAAAAYVSGIAIEQHRIRERQSSLMAILEATPDIVMMLDGEGNVFYMNWTGLDQLGIEREQLSNIRLQDLMPPEEAARMMSAGFATARRDGIWRDQTQFSRPDRSRLATSQVLIAHWSADGEFAYYSSIARDINERIAAENALRTSEARNRTLVDSAPEAILVFDVDQGRFVDLNENACRMFGMSREKLCALGPLDISDEEQLGGIKVETILPEQIAQVLTGEKLVFEWRFKHSSGVRVPAEVRLVRLPSSDRRLIRVSTNDISARKRAERSLRESELRFQGIFNQTFGWIGVMTPHGTLVDINDTGLKATGLRRDSVLGEPFWNAPWWAGGRQMRDDLECACGEAMSGRLVKIRLAYHAADGSLRQMDCIISPIHTPQGGISMLVAEGHDVTDRLVADRKVNEYADRLQALSQQLLETQEAERRHIARELHDEIGQALTALKINLHAASTQVSAATGPVQELFSDSLEITENLLAQVRDLSLDLRPSMLDDLGLEAALRWYTGRQAQRTGIRIEFRPPRGGTPRLATSVETACFRLVQEAITNVVRHASATNVLVEIVPSDGRLCVKVSDDGAGFDVEALSETARRGGSFGLVGMSERVQLAGGNVRVVSTAGSGTLVDANFPIPGLVASDGHAEGAA